MARGSQNNPRELYHVSGKETVSAVVYGESPNTESIGQPQLRILPQNKSSEITNIAIELKDIS